MDEAVNRFARDLIDAITVAIGSDPKVLACQRRAREAGIELKLAFEAEAISHDRETPGPGGRVQACDFTESDRRFLRSLRIAADQAAEPEPQGL